MSNILKITCPKCKVIFDAGDAFNTHFKNAQIESEKKLKAAQKQAVQDVENKYKSQLIISWIIITRHLYLLNFI